MMAIIKDVIIEGSGIRVTTTDNNVYQGVFKFTGGGVRY